MLYKVTKQYLRGTPLPVAEFSNQQDARSFIQEKLIEDFGLKIKTIYQLLEGMEVIEEFSEPLFEQRGSEGSDAGQRSRFQPTPFNATPRPASLPSHWLKDETEEDQQK